MVICESLTARNLLRSASPASAGTEARANPNSKRDPLPLIPTALANPVTYWELCILGFLAYAYACVRGALSERAGRSQRLLDALSPALAVACFLLLRWPALFSTDAFIDESQMLAQAIAALHDPVPWAAFDGTTAGPFDTYALALPMLLGMPASVHVARIVSTGLVAVLIVAQYWIVCPLYSGTLARLSLLVPILLFGFGSSLDLRMYASELLPIALMTSTLAFCAALAAGRSLAAPWIVVAGALCGTIPFAKLQGALLAATCAALTLAAIWRRADSPALALRRAGIFLLGLALPTLLILVPVALRGAFGDFYISYIAQSIAYSQTRETVHLKWAILFTPEYKWFFRASAAALAFFTVVRIAGAYAARSRTAGDGKRLRTWGAPAASLLLLAVAWYSVLAPHHDYYTHYWLLVVVPLTLAVVTFAGAVQAASSAPLARTALAGLALYLIVVGVPIVQIALATRPAALTTAAAGSPIAKSGVARTIAALGGASRIAVWGYSPQIYVDTGARLGTRDSIAQFAIIHGRYQDYYRRRFLSDLEANRPRIFVDSTGPSDWAFKLPKFQGLQSFPELDAYVTGNYTPVANEDGMHVFLLGKP